MLSRGKKLVLLTRPTSPIERNEAVEFSVPPSDINQNGSNSVLPNLTSPHSNTVIDDENSTENQTGCTTGTDSGDDFKPPSSSSSSSNSSSSSSSSSDSSSENEAVDDQESTSSPKTRGRKRTRNPNSWKKNIAKKLRNSGKCRLACSSHFTQEKRIQIFKSYWELGSIERHRDFLNSCIRPLEIASRRIKTNRRYPRQGSSAFYLLNDSQSIRVCKTFLINTLGISPRTIRTVIDASKLNDGIIPEDHRGKHGKHCKLDNDMIKAVKDHIESIPKVESHYLRANTSRLFIDGGLTIAELHRNYKEVQKQNNKPAVNYDAYQRIFNHDFNIGFFRPKKDLCDQCVAYKNAPEQEKVKLYASYKIHQEEKSLSRIEKDRDMKECQDPQSTKIV
ncbi:unnamed protein product [Diatraea saccharalis]|uniref:Uncharacterized protein n=1 Tax=Diatraea saccharalis TaxID=40085 RepID=A0A9N9WG99_9NEOP|nr:unnamed protein product [Diatraea saccharalis]